MNKLVIQVFKIVIQRREMLTRETAQLQFRGHQNFEFFLFREIFVRHDAGAELVAEISFRVRAEAHVLALACGQYDVLVPCFDSLLLLLFAHREVLGVREYKAVGKAASTKMTKDLF